MRDIEREHGGNRKSQINLRLQLIFHPFRMNSLQWESALENYQDRRGFAVSTFYYQSLVPFSVESLFKAIN